jgi:hypothetical protein
LCKIQLAIKPDACRLFVYPKTQNTNISIGYLEHAKLSYVIKGKKNYIETMCDGIPYENGHI